MSHPESRYDWRDEAACKREDPELFFPEGTSGAARLQTEEAKAVCRGCAVIDICLKWAVDNDQRAGIWGGLTEKKRRHLKARNNRASPMS